MMNVSNKGCNSDSHGRLWDGSSMCICWGTTKAENHRAVLVEVGYSICSQRARWGMIVKVG